MKLKRIAVDRRIFFVLDTSSLLDGLPVFLSLVSRMYHTRTTYRIANPIGCILHFPGGGLGSAVGPRHPSVRGRDSADPEGRCAGA